MVVDDGALRPPAGEAGGRLLVAAGTFGLEGHVDAHDVAVVAVGVVLSLLLTHHVVGRGHDLLQGDLGRVVAETDEGLEAGHGAQGAMPAWQHPAP